VWNCRTGGLAHLGLARANALESRTSQGAGAASVRTPPTKSFLRKIIHAPLMNLRAAEHLEIKMTVASTFWIEWHPILIAFEFRAISAWTLASTG
jgi:hypothetical protein